MNGPSRAAAALALAALVPLGACNMAEEDEETATGQAGKVDRTLAVAIANAPDLTTVSSALSEAGLAGVFDGPGSYTVLAPQDEAFAKLGQGAEALTADENRALLVAVMRDHILPGHVTPDAIREAVRQNRGSVSMRTLGEGEVEFSLDGESIVVSGDQGMSGRIAGEALAASNGVVMPVDALLKVPQPVPAQ